LGQASRESEATEQSTDSPYRFALNPRPLVRDILHAGPAGAFACRGNMEDLFEFLFGASGRISRAEYWRSLVIYCVAGLFVAVILLTAAGLAAPFFIVMVVLVLIPWLMWGFAIHTERLHDRDKSAWWLVMFFLLPGALDQIAKLAWFGGAISAALHFVLALAAFALTMWGFVEIGCLRGSAGANSYGPDPLAEERRMRAAARH
jgi:uncharacterized membrane protein YhaH (DUF805 family)